MKRTTTMALALALSLGGIAGCASKGEREFGSSVRHMIAGQRDNPASPEASVGSVDGAKAARAVDAYRSGKKATTAATPATSAILVPSAAAQ